MPIVNPETLTAFEALLDGYFRRLEMQAEGVLAANRPGELDRALAELEVRVLSPAAAKDRAASLGAARAEFEMRAWDHVMWRRAARPQPRLVWSR